MRTVFENVDIVGEKSFRKYRHLFEIKELFERSKEQFLNSGVNILGK